MNPLSILRLVFWRPLPVFIAGAFLSIALTIKGPSGLGLLLVSPGILAVQGFNAVVRTEFCNQAK